MATVKRAAAPRKKEESTLLARIRLAVGARPDFLVTRVNVGVFKVGRGRVRSAPDGFPDLIGTHLRRVQAREVIEHTFGRHERDYWHVYGQSIAIETKAAKGKLSVAQRDWCDSFVQRGGIYILARSLEDVYAVLGHEAEGWTR